jgi:predicted nucleotidyltransferase
MPEPDKRKKLEQILMAVKGIFSNSDGIESVLLRGSAATGRFVEGRSDVDLSVILTRYDFLKINEINKSASAISETVGTKISITYTDMEELERDKIIGVHYHGTKTPDYTKEIGEHSKVIYGKDFRPHFLQYEKTDIKAIYFDASIRLADYIKMSSVNKKGAYLKGIKYAFISAKQILGLEGTYELDKDKIIKTFGKIDYNAAKILSKAHHDARHFYSLEVNEEKMKMIFDFLVFCKSYVGEKLKKRDGI